MFKKFFGNKTATVEEVFGNPIPVAVETQIDLLKKIDASKVSLAKVTRLNGRKMAVRVYVDASTSMGWFYSRGVVQELTERALGFVLAMDSDGMVPVYTFDYKNVFRANVTVDNYRGIVASKGFYRGGSTNLSDSLDDLERAAKITEEPIYALIVTDGAPDNRKDVAERIKRLASYKVFIKILVIGNNSSAWDYVSGLDNMTEGRLLDNVDAQRINDPSKLSDQEFSDIMVEELDGWFGLAANADIL